MSKPETNLTELLRALEPALNPGAFVFATVPLGTTLDSLPVVASFREPEGLSIIISEAEAMTAKLSILFCAAWITLKVHSDLHAVGLTAAVATALTDVGISCNVVAAAHHDHIFVPVERAQEAMAQLLALQRRASS